MQRRTLHKLLYLNSLAKHSYTSTNICKNRKHYEYTHNTEIIGTSLRRDAHRGTITQRIFDNKYIMFIPNG